MKIRWLVDFSCPGKTGESATSKEFKPGDVCLATAAADFLEIDGVRCTKPRLGTDFELVHETKSEDGRVDPGMKAPGIPGQTEEKVPTWTGATRSYGEHLRK